MIKYLKPSGIEMDVNDTPEVRELAERLGWKEVNPEPEREKSKSKPKNNDKVNKLDNQA